MSIQVVLGYIITSIGALLIPGVFGDIPTSPDVWVLRIIGSITIILGILILGRRIFFNSNSLLTK